MRSVWAVAREARRSEVVVLHFGFRWNTKRAVAGWAERGAEPARTRVLDAEQVRGNGFIRAMTGHWGHRMTPLSSSNRGATLSL